jgi:hypothetical protein
MSIYETTVLRQLLRQIDLGLYTPQETSALMSQF